MILYRFEWDDEKDAKNLEQHGVAFVDAQEAFYDTNRIIIHDE
ncbi:MAG: BrnT family toxin [Rhizonema sp. PD38]|nr:BrnT family toxin [Rhizonema sp. PD38]